MLLSIIYFFITIYYKIYVYSKYKYIKSSIKTIKYNIFSGSLSDLSFLRSTSVAIIASKQKRSVIPSIVILITVSIL